MQEKESVWDSACHVVGFVCDSYKHGTMTNAVSNNKNKMKTVSFGTIEIREYNRILSPYPHLQLGLGLGWKFQQHHPIHLDDVVEEDQDSTVAVDGKDLNHHDYQYHFQKQNMYPRHYQNGSFGSSNSTTTTMMTRRKRLLPMDPSQRCEILLDYGYKLQELMKAETTRAEGGLNDPNDESEKQEKSSMSSSSSGSPWRQRGSKLLNVLTLGLRSKAMHRNR